jgi:hypothetical protein
MEIAMKLWIGVVIFIWVLCGFAGEWRLDGLGYLQFKAIAKGPITLAKAFNDDPVTYPGPD